MRILVIENEYLIAMDAERILMDPFSCEVVIGSEGELSLSSNEHGFDIAIVDFSTSLGSAAKNLLAAMVGSSKLIFTTVIDELAAGIPGFEATPVVLKPYNDTQLVNAVKSLLCAK